MDALWNRAAETGEAIPVGRVVECDWCGVDFTTSDRSGGLIFGSYATCPDCAPRVLADAEKYGEQAHIRARCAEGQSFADFVRAYRGPGATIRIRRVD